jgi:hypothetical protein
MNPYNFIPPQVLGIVTLVGVYCLILAYQKQHEIQKVLSKGIKTTGIVVEILQDPSGNGGGAPVVEFDYPNGSYRHHSNTYVSPCAYSVGQQVEIWYLFYKSNRTAALPDEEPGTLPKTLLKWGIVLCLLSLPGALLRLTTLI